MTHLLIVRHRVPNKNKHRIRGKIFNDLLGCSARGIKYIGNVFVDMLCDNSTYTKNYYNMKETMLKWEEERLTDKLRKNRMFRKSQEWEKMEL